MNLTVSSNLVPEFMGNFFTKERRKRIFSILLHFDENSAFLQGSGISNEDNMHFLVGQKLTQHRWIQSITNIKYCKTDLKSLNKQNLVQSSGQNLIRSYGNMKYAFVFACYPLVNCTIWLCWLVSKFLIHCFLFSHCYTIAGRRELNCSHLNTDPLFKL